STTAVWTRGSRSAGGTVDRPPPRRRTGVRRASTITTLVISPAYVRPPLRCTCERRFRAPPPAPGHARHQRRAVVPCAGQPDLRGRGGARRRRRPDLPRDARHDGVLGDRGADRIGARRRHVHGPEGVVRPPSGAALDVGGSRRPAGRLGAYPSILRAVRPPYRAVIGRTGQAVPGLRPPGVSPPGTGRHHAREPGRGGAL